MKSVSTDYWKWTSVFFTILHILSITTVDSSPLRERHICGLVQCKESKKFHYKAGTVYSYRYTVNVTTSIEGGPGEESGMHLSSAIAIKFLTGCEAVLSMKDVEVWESHLPTSSDQFFRNHHFTRPQSDGTFSRALQEFSLRFSYADGLIQEICPDVQESILMLNVKRGLLSAFQNTMRRLDLEHKGEEEDIHGKCKLEYTLGLATASNLPIEIRKDIGSCGDKFGILSTVQGTPYHFGTLHQSMPAVASTSECKHVVDRNLISGVHCIEKHKLQSLSRGTGAAQTRIEQKLDLTSVHNPTKTNTENDDSLPSVSQFLDPMFSHLVSMTQTDVFRRESLQFRHDFHLAPKPNDRITAQNALTNFCASLKEDVSNSAGDTFETLVSILRGLNFTDMMSLSEEATDICQGDRTPFHDALEAVGTAASVHVIKEKILKGDASPATIQSWIASLTYIPKPDLEVMEGAVDILRERGKYPEILLTFSTLAHSYCRSNSNCSAHRPIDILSRLYKKFFLHTGCVARQNSDVEQILMYLHGIGNFGLYSLGIRDAVSKCILRNDRTEIRVAAIEAYRRMGCSPEMDFTKSLFENEAEDSEVRIAAFLSLMRCPTYDTIQSIKKFLETEQVNQVGSFVVSYLENLQETALPSKAELQGLVSDEKFSKKFSPDFRKFSRSFEVSSFYDDFNFGVGVESNLIFSQKSYLPRSASLNLTVDLFGESINVFEATVRVENFERYIESLFGPNGKFRNQELHSIVSSFREKRATPNKRRLRQLAFEFDAMRSYNSDPTASLSFKTFGNEILYKRSVGLDSNTNFIQALNPFHWLKTLANQNSNFQKSKMLLDSTYIIPTGAGLPLNLTAHASAILKMDSETEFISEISEFKIKGKLKPSALFAVTGSMVCGTSHFQTGIKVKAQLRSSTAIDANFHIRGTELIQAEFGLPQTQLEVLQYKSELLFVQGKISHVVGKPPSKPLICSRGFVEEMFGLKLCHSFHFNLSPNSEVDDLTSPYFPLNGPAFFNLVVEKTNPSLMSSKVSYISVQNETNSKLEATYGIKSAEHTKSFGLIYDMDRVNQNLSFGITLPGKELRFSGRVETEGHGGIAEITVVSNSVQVFRTMISFVNTEEEAGNGKALLKPEILINLYNTRIVNANGEIKLARGQEGLMFNGTGILNLDATSPINVRLNGLYNTSKNELNFDVDYGEDSKFGKQTVQWKSALNTNPGIETKLSLQFSELPEYNLEANWKYQNGESTINSEGDLQIGRGPAWSDLTTLHVRHQVQVTESYTSSDATWMFEVTYPAQQSQWGIDGSLSSAGNYLNTTINIQYAPGKKIQGSLALEKAPAGALITFGLGAMVQIPNQHPLTIGLHIKETALRNYEGKVGGNWFGRASLSLELNLVDQSLHHKLDNELLLGIAFGRTWPDQQIKLRYHIYSDDEKSKLRLSSEHQSQNYFWEVGHALINEGSKRHRVYTIVNPGGLDYLVAIESGIDAQGLETSIETTFNSKFPDIYAGLKVIRVSGEDTIGLEYKWDATRDPSKSFTLVITRDSSQLNHIKYKFNLRDPTRNYILSAEQKQEVDRSKTLKGKISWSPSDQVTFGCQFKRVQGQPNSYEISADSQTPFKEIMDTLLKIRLDCNDEQDCVISIEGSWGPKGRLSGIISSEYEVLLRPEPLAVQEGDSDEVEDSSEFSRSSQERLRITSRRKLKGSDDMSPTRRLQPESGYRFRFNANVTATLQGWESLSINMQHTQTDPFHLKTDIDIQLPQGKELSISNHLDLPRSLKDIWSTRVHFQAKTPFPNYQLFDVQGILGHQEDIEKLATFGIYTDHSQYVVTITGSKDEGSFGIDLVTSLPNYDKIFGSLSYDVGESPRLACQLGWPKVVIGLETGFEWTGNLDGGFQTFLTFNSSWEPLQNINMLAKVDISQAEFKCLVNEEGVTAKSEWVLETWDNFDLRFDATSPFPSWRRIGFIAKQSLEEAKYYSQLGTWIDEAQIGYKLEGVKGELEDEETEGSTMNCHVEIDTIVYPTIKGTTTVVRREAKYNVEASLVLREGPINLSLDLNLLESYRFNEKITITTPYPGLHELQINLRPALIPENNLYNFGIETKWKSNGEENEVGLIIRIGDQKVLADALSRDLEDEVGEDNEGEESEGIRSKVIIPTSQLLQFTSPWKWVKVIKLELEKIPEGKTSDDVSVNTDDYADEVNDGDGATNPRIKPIEVIFPWKTVVILFDGDWAEFYFNIENEIGEKMLSAGISLPEIQSPLSLKFQSKLDLEHSEKKLKLEASSLWPSLQMMQLESSYQKENNFLNVRVDLQTPFDSWESQYASVIYAFDSAKEMGTLDLEASSDTHGKLASNIVRSPLTFGLVLNTPFQGYTSMEFETTSELLEDAEEENTYATKISTKLEEQEILIIAAETTMENEFPKRVNGTIRTILRDDQGNFGILMRGTADELNANGQIDWRPSHKLSFGLRLKMLEKKFQELDLKVDTPFEGYKKWDIGLKKVSRTNVEDNEERKGNDEENDADEDENSVNFLLHAETPWRHFSPLTGKMKITWGSVSYIGLNVLNISGSCPNASLDLTISWILSHWNQFQIRVDSKYSHALTVQPFSNLANSNFVKFKIGNFIPDFTKRIESGISFETQNPDLRFGTSAFLAIEDRDSNTSKHVRVVLTSTIPSSSHRLVFISNFNYDLRDLSSELTLTSLPSTEILFSTVKIHEGTNSLDGDVVFKWNDIPTLQSKFNCTYSPGTFGVEGFQAQLFLPKRGSPSDVIGSIEATFHPSNCKVRIEGKRIGDDEPILVDLDLSGHWAGTEEHKYLDSKLTIKSPYDDLPSSDFYLQGKVDEGIHAKIGGVVGSVNGSIGGYWHNKVNADGITAVNGTFELDLPLTLIESIRLDGFALVQDGKITGLMKLIVNNVEHIDSTYKYESRMSHGSESYFTKLLFRNQFWPFGLSRSSSYSYSPGSTDLIPTTIVQFVEVYDLVHSDLHKLGGELRIERSSNGREITLTGLHPLRNVSLNCKYDFLENEFRQNVTFQWAKESRMGYELRLHNLSSENERRVDVKVKYPVRVIRLASGYKVEEQSGQVWTELVLNSTASEDRGLKGIIKWDTKHTPAMTFRKVSGIIKHPLLPQDIRGSVELDVIHGHSIEGKVSLDYSDDPNRRLTFATKTIRTTENGYFWNLTTDMRLQHVVTKLDLKAFHSNRHLPHELSIITLIDFKNTGKVSRESKIIFELFKQLKILQLMLANPDEQLGLSCQFQNRQGIYHFLAETNITGYNPPPKAEMILDSNQPYFRMTAIHGKDGTNGLYSEGGVVDPRNFKFDVSESYNDFRFSDVNFFLRMNHSRLVTSKLIWRPELFDELQASYVSRIENLKEIWNHQSDKLLLNLWTDSTEVFNQVWENAKTTIEPFMEEIRQNCDFRKDSEVLSQYFEEALEQNEFYLDDITALAQIFADQVSLRFSNVFINLRQYREEILGETTVTELFENCLLWILEKAKEQYRAAAKVWESFKPHLHSTSSRLTFEFPSVTEGVANVTYQVVDMGIAASEFVFQELSSWMSFVNSQFQKILEQHRPEISATVHKIEVVLYDFVLGITDFIYETRDEVIKSTYYQKFTQLAQDVDELYQDLLENDIPANTTKYYAMFTNFLHKKTNFEEIRRHFDAICQKLKGIWAKFMNLGFVKELKDSMAEISDRVKWLSEYTNFEKLTSNVILTLYEKGPELMRQTVLEANAKYQQAKTKFIFDADKGVMDWEQKLPMPWSAFNIPPRFTELPEYQGILKLKEFFQSSRNSYFDLFHHSTQTSQIGLYPPFDGHAMVAVSDNFFTFDGRSYSFSGSSVYLLVGDLVEGNFTISIDYRGLSDSTSKKASLIVTSSHNTLIIDFDTKTLRDPKRLQNVGLPIQMHHLQGYRDGESLVVQSPKGEFSVDCNLVYGLCQLRINGWYSRKVGGLLGTMDYEPTTDLIYSNAKVAVDIQDMARTWDVSDGTLSVNSTLPETRTETEVPSPPDSNRVLRCNKLFVSHLSDLHPCFDAVNVRHYLDICLNGIESHDKPKICLAAMAYKQICHRNGIEVQMPSVCIQCDLSGEAMIDGDVKVMDQSSPTTRSADIVFIVEAKDCNKQVYVKKRLEGLVNTMEMDLEKTKIKNNRYAVVSFGGEEVFRPARSITVQGQAFTNFDKLANYFKSIQTSNSSAENEDVFAAIRYTLNFNFRPGVAKILILLPCTSCQPQAKKMKTDFSTVQHALLEQGFSLHLLLNKDLELDDKKIAKKFFGMDNSVVFTKSDGAKAGLLKGNRLLRGEVNLSKNVLGHCGALALRTNGTIFNGNKLQHKKEQTINAFSRLFSRRIAKAAEPPNCQSCSCFRTKDGTGLLKCHRCDYQRPNLRNQVEPDNAEQVDHLREISNTMTVSSTFTTAPKTAEEDDERNALIDGPEDSSEDYEDYPEEKLR